MAVVQLKESFASQLRAFYTGALDGGEYVPFEYPGPDGKPMTFGEIQLIRETGHDGNSTLAVGLWKTEAGLSPEYTFPGGDETFLVVEGAVTITLLDTGEEVSLKVGDFASFVKGTRSQWNFHTAFKKFVIVSDCTPGSVTRTE